MFLRRYRLLLTIRQLVNTVFVGQGDDESFQCGDDNDDDDGMHFAVFICCLIYSV